MSTITLAQHPEDERLDPVGEAYLARDTDEREQREKVDQLHAAPSISLSAAPTCIFTPMGSASSSMSKRGW